MGGPGEVVNLLRKRTTDNKVFAKKNVEIHFRSFGELTSLTRRDGRDLESLSSRIGSHTY